MYTENKILLGSSEFKAKLEYLAENAKDCFLVQSMTFEGDAAGEWLINTMLNSPAIQKILVIDDYSNWVVNDTMLMSPAGILNPNLRAEYRNAQKLIALAQSFGIKVHVSNPIGLRFYTYPSRNHKKSIVIDNVCLLGGINFSDHNFDWYDMMIQFDDDQLVDLVADDILKNSSGVKTSGYTNSGTEELFILSPTSTDIYSKLFDKIRTSHQRIDIFSPYLSDPLLSVLASISDQTDIHIYTPEKNNKGIFNKLLHHKLQGRWFTLHQLPGIMSHLKAILIDDHELIVGSSNYDFASYFFEEEILIATSNQSIIDEFIQRVKSEIVSKSVEFTQPESHPIINFMMTKIYKILLKFDTKSLKI
ncbi:MAG TPA: hypothetical protein DCE78_00520 [Bacteroidetes bacterium]|nr:hypothetical protein [Bacteroidota bacterium]